MSTMTRQPRINIWGYNTIAKQILSPVILGAVLFALAGTTDWVWGWVFNILHVLVWLGMTIALAAWNPELLNARGKRGEGTKSWDMVLLGIYGMSWIVLIVVAGLDYRYGWTNNFPTFLAWDGCLLMIVGFVLTTWSMVVNRNFEPTVRLQDDREHHVIRSGPYAYVRHPGYVGVMISFFLGMPLVLNSYVALIPALIGAVVMMIRTAMEDRTLQAELPGYKAYAEDVRFRLAPGLW